MADDDVTATHNQFAAAAAAADTVVCPVAVAETIRGVRKTEIRLPNRTDASKIFNSIQSVFRVAFAKPPDRLSTRIAVNVGSAYIRM